ncbi:MAG: hypothetical protein ACO3SE_05675 [Sedimenticolaceae bacterium]
MGMVNQGGMINREDLIAEIGLGDISDAVVEYSRVRLTYLVCGVVRGIEERDVDQIIEYGTQLSTLAALLYADRLASLVNDILHLAEHRLFHESNDCLVVLLEMNKQVAIELSSLKVS